MKKNFSFLKSALALGLFSLISVSAMADTDKIWGSTQTVTVGDVVTFVDKANKQVYNGYKEAAGYTDNPSTTGVGFTVAAGSETGTYAFTVKENGVTKYFIETGEIDVNEITPEVSWTVAGSKIKSASTSAKYVYYDNAKKYFWTTASERTCDIFKQYTVAKPAFAKAAGTYAYVAGSSEYVSTFGIFALGNSETDASKKVYGTADGATIEVSINGGAYETVSNGQIDLKEYMTKLTDTEKKAINIKARTKYNDGTTTEVTVTYYLVEMNPITFSADTNTTNRVKDNGTYVVTAKSEKAELSVGLAAANVAAGATIDIAGKAKFQETAESVTVYAKATRMGAAIVANEAFAVYTNVLPSEVFAETIFNTEAKWNASPLNEVSANETFSAWYDYSATSTAIAQVKKYELSYDATKTVMLQAEGAEAVAAKKAELKNGKLVVTVPYSIKNKDYVVTIPAGALVATIKEGNKTVNKFATIAALSGKYHAADASVTYNINPDQIEVPVSDESQDLEVEFKLWPVNDAKDVVVNFEEGVSELSVKITDINNVDQVTGAKATKKAGEPNTFVVKFNASQVRAYIRAQETAETGLLVVFPAKKLHSVNHDQNIGEVTSRMKFVEDVAFTITNADSVCAHSNILTVTVAARGKVNTSKYYESSVATGATVKVGGKDCAIKRTAVKATGDVETYEINLAPVAKNGQFEVEFADKLFAAFKSKSGATKNATHIYAHPTFTFTPKMGVKNESITVEVAASVPSGYDFEDGDLLALAQDTLLIDGVKFAYKAGAVKNHKIVLEVKDPTAAVLADGNHTLKIYANSFKAAGNETCKNVATEVPFTVKPWVVFSTNPYNLVRIDTETKDVTFPVYLKRGNAQELYAGATLEAKGQLSYNDGENNRLAKITKIVEVGNGEYAVTATLAAALQARANNYELYVAQDSLFADNYNFETFSVAFKVFNHIEISAESPVAIDPSDKVAPIQIHGWDVVDDYSADVNIELAAGTKFTIGTTEYTPAAQAKYGLYNIDVNLAEGVYDVVIPAKAVKANASENAEALNVKLTVEKFELPTVHITQNQNEFSFASNITASSAFTVQVVDTCAAAHVRGTVSFVKVENGAVTLALNTILAKGEYTYTVDALTFTGKYGKNSKKLTGKIVVYNAFDFADYSKNDKTTTSAQVAAAIAKDGAKMDTLTFSRNFTSTKWQAMSYPFPISVKAANEQGIKIYKYDFVHTDSISKKQYFELKELAETASTLPNMPYVIQSNAIELKKVVLTNVDLSQPSYGNVWCATTSVDYEIVGNSKVVTLDPAMYTEAFYTLSGGSFRKLTGKGDLPAWRTYVYSYTYNPYYAPSFIDFTIDGEVVDEEGYGTGIKVIDAVNTESNEGIYNLNGMKMNSTVKGLNIVNGKKVLVK